MNDLEPWRNHLSLTVLKTVVGGRKLNKSLSNLSVSDSALTLAQLVRIHTHDTAQHLPYATQRLENGSGLF